MQGLYKNQNCPEFCSLKLFLVISYCYNVNLTQIAEINGEQSLKLKT